MFYKSFKSEEYGMFRVGYLFNVTGDKNFSGFLHIREFRGANDLLWNFQLLSRVALDKVFEELYSTLGDDFVVVVIPKTKGVSNYKSACYNLCEKIINKAKEDGKNITDGSRLLELVSNDQVKGSEEYIGDSILLKNTEAIKGKDVLIIDDLISKDETMTMVRDLLIEYGAKDVKGFAVGNSEIEKNYPYHFIFNLDNVILDTSNIQKYINEKNWEDAFSVVRSSKIEKKMEELIDRVHNLRPNPSIFIITSMPRIFADKIAERINFDTRFMITLNDGYFERNNLENYLAANAEVNGNLQSTVVVGARIADLEEAKRIGMTTVLANWYNSEKQSGDCADFVYDDISDFVENIDIVLEGAKEFYNYTHGKTL